MQSQNQPLENEQTANEQPLPEVPDLLAWVLALSPLAGILVVYLLPTYGRLYYGLLLWSITGFDYFVIYKSGRDMQLSWELTLTPLYLYKRYKLLGDPAKYFLSSLPGFALLVYFWLLVL